MRTIGSKTGFSGLALIALIAGVAACSAGTTTTTYGTPSPGDTPPPADGKTTDGTPIDPSTQGDPTSKDTPAPPLVKGLAITDVAVFQAVKVPVVTAGKVVGKATRNAPVVSGRPALVRVYVSPGAGYTPGEVTAELRLVNGTTRLPAIKDTKTITEDSSDEAVASTFNFEVPAESLPAGVTYQVLLTAKGGEVPTSAVDSRFPKEGGVQGLETEASGKLKVVIVPVKYDADGTGRVPDISAGQLALYKQKFMARYPTTEVELTARAPWSYSQAISANGSGFSAVLNAVTQLRRADGVPNDVYYYGAFEPKSTFGSFCGGGCVTGLSTVVDSTSTSTAYLRASVGVGFSGEDSTNTAAHEVGHAHGRSHAPCGGTSGTDPDFPYSTGGIGTWGYNILDKTFLSPEKGKDMMGYCPNEWVSDYTYKALFDRIAAVNGGTASAGSSGSGKGGGNFQASTATFHGTQTFRTAMLEGDGSVTWSDTLDLDEGPAGGETRAVTFVSAAGQTIGTHEAHFYPYDHLPGGVLFVPAAPKAATRQSSAQLQTAWSHVRISGVTNALAR